MSKSLSLENIRYELVESTGKNMQQSNTNNTENFPRRNWVVWIGQV